MHKHSLSSLTMKSVSRNFDCVKIVALWTFVALVATPSFVQGSEDSTLTSPCPRVFTYDRDRTEPGEWSGVATLSTDILLHSMWLNIVLDSPASAVLLQLQHWKVNTTTQNYKDFRFDNDDFQIRPDHPINVGIFIQYNPLNSIPKLRAIRLNGKVICDADTPQKTTVDKPIFLSTVRQPAPGFSDSEIKTNPLQSPQSDNYPASPRPANNSSTAFNPAIITNGECGVIAGGNARVPLINYGFFYDRGEIPWLVAIYRIVDTNLLFICGGTLVSDRHVVTAAHCMKRGSIVTPKTEIVVKVGVHRLNDWSDDLTVTRTLLEATIHEKFNPITLQNDILVLTLNKRVKFNNYIRPACLWTDATELSRVVGATGVVAGWGARSEDDIRGKLDEPQMVRVPIVSTKECRASKSDFHRLTYDTTLCAGDRNGVGPCRGDSGGGLYLLEGGKWRLRGVVSISVQSENGARTCNLNEYVVYTDTAQFLPWIRNILSEKYYD